jgi:3-oxoacyl-[acyl-carrier protein] reductase
MDLKNKIAIVTGASMGIGKSIAVALAKEGAKVVLAARTLEKLQSAKEEIDSFNGDSLIVRTDLSREEQILSLFNRTIKEYGRLDIIVNNAAIALAEEFLSCSSKDFDELINVNLKSVYTCCQQALNIMLPQKNGVIINISSNVAAKCYERQAIYAASKCGVVGITKSIANEFHKDGILVALIHPGGVDTRLATLARPDIDKSLLIRPEDIADTVLYMLKLSGTAWVDEITVRRRAAKPF